MKVVKSQQRDGATVSFTLPTSSYLAVSFLPSVTKIYKRVGKTVHCG